MRVFGFQTKARLRVLRSEIAHEVNSPLFNISSPLLLNAVFNGRKFGDIITGLRATLPQNEPWTETAVRFDFGATRPLFTSLVLSGNLSYIQINRSNYQQNINQDDHNSNWLINGGLWWSPVNKIAVFLKGELSRNYLAGTGSTCVNQKTRRFFFEHPYLQLSSGVVVSF